MRYTDEVATLTPEHYHAILGRVRRRARLPMPTPASLIAATDARLLGTGLALPSIAERQAWQIWQDARDAMRERRREKDRAWRVRLYGEDYGLEVRFSPSAATATWWVGERGEVHSALWASGVPAWWTPPRMPRQIAADPIRARVR